MSDPKRDTATDAPLNPALRSRTDRTYDTDRITPAPFDSASAKEGEGEGWPIVWAVVTLLGAALMLYFIL
ncbi:MAG: hypothetical protein ACXWUP_07770 [Allosphingosinicella sp.]